MEGVAVFPEANGQKLKKLQRKLMHLVILIGEVSLDPLELFLLWERSVFIQG